MSFVSFSNIIFRRKRWGLIVMKSLWGVWGDVGGGACGGFREKVGEEFCPTPPH